MVAHAPELEGATRDLAALQAYCSAHQLAPAGEGGQEQVGAGTMLATIFDKVVEATLIEPTFITQYPIEVSPLARRNDQDPFCADRFELFIGGRELANGFSELNNPFEQRKRFLDQQSLRDAGDHEANADGYRLSPCA